MKLILIFFSGEPKLSLTPKVAPLPNIKKFFLRLSACDDELLSTLKTIIFLTVSLSKLQ